MSKARGLGRGLSALIPEAPAEPHESVMELPLGALRPNAHQPRQRFDAERLAELAASVREHGILEPLVVRRTVDGFEIVAGERRWRAAGMAEKDTVPVVVRNVPDERMLEVALVENVQREDLGLWEEATALRALMQAYGWTQEQVAERVGKSRSHVANTLRVLALPDGARKLVEEGRLTLAHVKAILEAPPGRVEELAQAAAEQGWSVREVAGRVQAMSVGQERGGGRGPKAPRSWPMLLQEPAAAVGAQLGRPLHWRPGRSGGEIGLPVSGPGEAARLLKALAQALMFLEEQQGPGDVPRGTSGGDRP